MQAQICFHESHLQISADSWYGQLIILCIINNNYYYHKTLGKIRSFPGIPFMSGICHFPSQSQYKPRIVCTNRLDTPTKGQLATKQITWVVGIFAVFSLTITRLSLNWPLEGKLIETVLYNVRRNREYGHTDNTLSSFFAARRFNND